MLVSDMMTKRPVVARPDTSVPNALKIMQGSQVRMLPVLDEKEKLVGVVSLTDLFRALPSPASSLSRWEVEYLLDQVKVDEVMTRKVVTVTEDTAVEEAGRIMSERKVSGVPVMQGDSLVGMITESHLFGLLLDVFGAEAHGIRVTVRMPLARGGLSKLSTAVAGIGGRFVAFAESMDKGTATFKVQDVDQEALRKAIEPFIDEIVDLRET
jgi:acetoin utilization protein AcuB